MHLIFIVRTIRVTPVYQQCPNYRAVSHQQGGLNQTWVKWTTGDNTLSQAAGRTWLYNKWCFSSIKRLDWISGSVPPVVPEVIMLLIALLELLSSSQRLLVWQVIYTNELEHETPSTSAAVWKLGRGGWLDSSSGINILAEQRHTLLQRCRHRCCEEDSCLGFWLWKDLPKTPTWNPTPTPDPTHCQYMCFSKVSHTLAPPSSSIGRLVPLRAFMQIINEHASSQHDERRNNTECHFLSEISNYPSWPGK